jgi:hypothetical protein
MNIRTSLVALSCSLIIPTTAFAQRSPNATRAPDDRLAPSRSAGIEVGTPADLPTTPVSIAELCDGDQACLEAMRSHDSDNNGSLSAREIEGVSYGDILINGRPCRAELDGIPANKD